MAKLGSQWKTPAAMRVFGFMANCDFVDYGISTRSVASDSTEEMIQCGESPRSANLGVDLGQVTLPDGR